MKLHSKWDIFNDFETLWAFLDFLQILIWETVDAHFHINGHYSQLEMLYFFVSKCKQDDWPISFVTLRSIIFLLRLNSYNEYVVVEDVQSLIIDLRSWRTSLMIPSSYFDLGWMSKLCASFGQNWYSLIIGLRYQ